MSLPLRSEVNEKYTWDLTDLCKNNEEAKERSESLRQKIESFNSKYEGRLESVETALDAIDDYRKLLEDLVIVSTYSSLILSIDQSDGESLMISSSMRIYSTLIVI